MNRFKGKKKVGNGKKEYQEKGDGLNPSGKADEKGGYDKNNRRESDGKKSEKKRKRIFQQKGKQEALSLVGKGTEAVDQKDDQNQSGTQIQQKGLCRGTLKSQAKNAHIRTF